MTASTNTYPKAILPLIPVLVLAILATLFTDGAVRIAAVVVLVLLIVTLSALIWIQVARLRQQRPENGTTRA